MRASALLLCLAALPAAARGRVISGEAASERALEETWGKDLDQASKSPVQRVVKLLQDMKAQLEGEASKESEMYDKMVCWCETGEKDKTAAIAAAEVKISDLEASIESMSAKFGELGTNIAALKDQIAKDTEMLKEAVAIRESEASKFRDEEKDMVQALTNLNNAIAVLSRHQGGAASLLQVEGPDAASIRAVLRDVSLTYDLMLGDRAARKRAGFSSVSLLSVANKSPAAALREALGLSGDEALPAKFAEKQLATRAKELGADPTGKQLRLLQSSAGKLAPTAGSYSPQSDTIFGILTQMKDEFEANLSQEQKEEMKAIEDHEALKEAKTEQIASGKETLDLMEGEHSANVKALSDGKEDLQLTTEQRSEDVEYLRNLRLTCQDLDNQWEKRSKMRAEETKAVAEAVAIITEDDNREHLMNTISFLQEGREAVQLRRRRQGAAGILRKAAGDLDVDTDDLLAAWHGRGGQKASGAAGSPKARLSTLAVTTEIDSFTEVIKVMDKMVVDLKAEQAEEVQFKAYCEKEIRTNDKITYTKTEEKEDLEAKMQSLEDAIKAYEKEIEEAQAKIADNKKAMLSAGQTREAENKEFQTVVADQRAAQTILKKALGALKSFYDKKALLQQRQGESQTPPVQFNKYSKNAGSVSVMGLIEQIIGDSVALEKESIAAEAQAQADYETFAKDTTAENKALGELLVFKTKAIASANVEKSDAEATHAATVDELESLAQANADLHSECDWTVKNFDIRQKARLQEIEAIQKAKAFLSGEDKSGLVRQ